MATSPSTSACCGCASEPSTGTTAWPPRLRRSWPATGSGPPRCATSGVAAARELTSLLPDASLVVFDRSGHRPFEDEPALFEAAVGAFLHRGELFDRTAMHISDTSLPMAGLVAGPASRG